jgi:hypothetical protein
MPAPFDQFSRDMMNHFLPGQQAMQDIATGADGTNVQALSAAGAVSTTAELTELTISGTKAYTLADGPAGVAGRIKKIVCVSAASTPAGTLTIASPDDTTGFVCPATFFFDSVGQTLVLRWTGTKWRCIQKIRTGYKTLVVGTTVTTGIANMSHIVLSVTGTVASTTTMALPNGAAVGERLLISCSTAASTPHGDLGGTYISKLGVAGTVLDDFTAVTDHLNLEWTGAAWAVMIQNTTAVAVV